MMIRSLRDARKMVYRLAERDDPISRLLFRTVLFSYRCLDKLVLKHASRPDFGSEKYVMKDRRLLYVGVPKVATRSLLVAMESASSGGSHPGVFLECGVEDILRRYPEVDAYFKFTFVRNPWSRAASCYRDKIMKPDAIKEALHVHNRTGLEAGMPFEAFADWLNSADGSDDVADRHWMSQHRVLALDLPGVIKYDFVGRLENLLNDFGRLQELSGVSLPPLSHRLKTQAPDEYKDLYSDRSIEAIANRYQKDIELFGYSFDEAVSE